MIEFTEEDLKLSDEEFYKKWKFDDYEKELDQALEHGDVKELPPKELKEFKKRMAGYVKYTRLKREKSKNINIRIAPEDVEKLKSKALKVGIPYQTIAASILHQYANDEIEVKL